MKKEKFCKILILLLTVNWFNAQIIFVEDKAYKDIQNTQINKPSIGKLNDLTISDENVNLSTGVLTPSISLMEINSKFLSSDITLVYKSGNGVRINDISSDVGLGWDIEVGGYISRKVNGFADEGKLYHDAQVGVPGTSPVIQVNQNNFVNGWLDFANWSPNLSPSMPGSIPKEPGNNQSLGSAIQNFVNNVQNNNSEIYKWFRYFNAGLYLGPDGGGGWPPGTQPIGGSTVADLCAMSGFGWQYYDIDGEPDEYYFKFGKYSGKFVFDGDRKPVIIPHIPGLKIESPYGSLTNSWIFTTPEGIKYYFINTSDYYEILNSATNTDPFYDDWKYPTPNINEGLGITENISKWYLSKVVGINGETIEYEYAVTPDLIYSEKAEIKQVFRASPGSTQAPPSYFVGSGDPGFDERILDRTTHFRLKSPKRIIKIKTSDNNRIDFIYNGLEREDIDQSQNATKRKSLSSIEKYDFNNKLIAKIDFDQSYFNSGCNNYECKRLKLNNLKKINMQTHTDYLTTYFEYNTNDNLPQRNSNQQDYWGFYNNNGVNSLIPKVSSKSGYSYPGADRAPDESKATANILKKIVYPTKGSIEYLFELNDFSTDHQWSDFPITSNKTGGLRIKKIIKKERNNSNPIIKSFTYKLQNGKTSGELPSLIRTSTAQENNNGAGRMFERQKVVVDENSGETSVYVMIYSNPKYLFTNDLIRYSRVVVEIEGKGLEEFTLSSFSTHPDEMRIGRHWTRTNSSVGFQSILSMITNALYSYNIYNTPNIFTPDKSYMRGLVLAKLEKDNTGKILKETVNEYKINPIDYSPKVIYGIGVSSRDSFIAESSEITEIDFMINFYKSDYVYLERSRVKDHVSNPPVESLESNEYNSKAFLSSKNVSFANDDIYNKVYKYAHDKQIQKLIDANIINTPLETETKKNGKIISKSEIKYDNPTNLYPSSILEYDLESNSYVPEITYDLYDDKGNLLQYTNKYGMPITVIWGYKGTLPIATIEGITYADLANKLGFSNTNVGYKTLNIVTNSDADTNDTYETQTLIPSLNIFRQNNLLKDYKITTYTYDPLIGLKTVITPSGNRENYKYDGTNKLEKITDQNENIIEEYKYNYAEMVYYNSAISQSFTRNNCGSNAIGNAYTYSVPANQYPSTISQADADQQAQNDINTNGQNMANANGTCTTISCPLSFNTSIGIGGGGSISVTPNSYYKISFGFSSGPNSTTLPWNTGVKVAAINGICMPTAEYSSYNGQVYYTIKTNGDIILRTHTGTVPPNNTSYNYELSFPIN